VDGEKSVDGSSDTIDDVHTYLYDFPDPILKVGVQPRNA
jgi:hypothetical protein